jgi:hypothetical protein
VYGEFAVLFVVELGGGHALDKAAWLRGFGHERVNLPQGINVGHDGFHVINIVDMVVVQ